MKIVLDSHNLNHAISILSFIPIYKEFGIETGYINKILKETATIYARLINQNRFSYDFLFSASFYKSNEEDQRSDEIDIIDTLNFNHNLTESDINNTDVRSQLEHQIQFRQTKESVWIFDNFTSVKRGI